MTTNDDFARTLREATDKSSAALADHSVEKRRTSIALMRATLDHAAAAESQRLRRALATVEEQRSKVLAEAEARAESTRRARASALLTRLFEGKLRTLVDEFRAEPTRRGATAIRETWDKLDSAASDELGEGLGWYLLATIFADSLLAESASAGAVTLFSTPTFGGTDDVSSAVHRATHGQTAEAVETALRALDAILSEIAARAAAVGCVADPRCAELHQLRHAHATTRDLTQARTQVEARHNAAAHAAFVKGYVPPPTLNDFFAGRLAGLRGESGL